MSAAFGEIRVFTQEHGPDVRLRVFGDEFYARYETSTGYTSLYDSKLGLYCYATLSDGHLTSLGIPISAPPPADLREHLKESKDVRNTRFNDQFGSLRPYRSIEQTQTGPEVYGPNEGLLEGRQLNKGPVRGLTILVDFQDVQTEITRDEVDALLNGEKCSTNGNYCSVKEYFSLMSSGELTYTNVVVGPVKLSQNRRYYVDHLLAKEALDLVGASGLDFRQFDWQGINVIDAVSFMYAGETLWEGDLWPHNSVVRWRSPDGFHAGMYQITGLGLHASDLAIGTFCHESGHMLCRFPDLYDYGKRDGDFESSAGLGVYCLMSAGNHLDAGRTPAPICAYLRYLAEWCPNQISLNTLSVGRADHGAYNTVLIYRTTRTNEFFLLENRNSFGLDVHLPSHGLAIYHCDTEGSNERQSGTAEEHYQCSLLQADGRRDLEHNANQGDPNDFFVLVQGEALSGSTNPSTKMWDGSDSGLRIADITSAGQTITFSVTSQGGLMNTNGPTSDADSDALKRVQEQARLLQANLDLYKLTVQAEQEKLKAEVDKTRLEADKQKAEMDKVKALLPSGTTKPLSGETKTDEKFGYLAKLAAHHAVKNAAQTIADQILGVKYAKSENPARIMLVDTLDLCGDDFQALLVSQQMAALKTDMTEHARKTDELLPQTERQGGPEAFTLSEVLPVLAQTLTGVPGMISWAADIAAYFQPDDTYKSVDVTVPLVALQTCIAHALKDKQTIELRFPNFHTFSTLTDLPILKEFRECSEMRRKLSAQAMELKIRMDSLTKVMKEESLLESPPNLKLAEAAYATSQSLIQAFDDFSKLMVAVPEGKSYSPLARVAMREYLKKELHVTHLLHLNVISSGGELSLRKFLWFFHGIVFLGGCVVTYVLADLSGKTLATGTVSKLYQTKYRRGQRGRVQFEDLTALTQQPTK